MINHNDAEKIISEVKSAVAKWREVAVSLGIAKREIDMFEQIYRAYWLYYDLGSTYYRIELFSSVVYVENNTVLSIFLCSAAIFSKDFCLTRTTFSSDFSWIECKLWLNCFMLQEVGNKKKCAEMVR